MQHLDSQRHLSWDAGIPYAERYSPYPAQPSTSGAKFSQSPSSTTPDAPGKWKKHAYNAARGSIKNFFVKGEVMK